MYKPFICAMKHASYNTMFKNHIHTQLMFALTTFLNKFQSVFKTLAASSYLFLLIKWFDLYHVISKQLISGWFN